MKKVHITTLGCSKNLVDSEVLQGQLEYHDFQFVDQAEQSDLLIVNTCGFIEKAKEESIQAIFEALELKKADPAKKVFVTGCLSERYRADIEKDIPEVDAIFGTEDYRAILQALGKKHAANDNLYRLRRVTTPRHFAYLKISEGCNHTCAFCAIPGIRGKHRSRTVEALVEEARKLAAGGARELILISQDTSYYGKDIYGKQSITRLLQALEQVEGIRWIRVLYWYPTNFPLDVLDFMKDSARLVPYLDMPIQHVSDRMLKLMRRGDSRRSLEKLYETILSRVPGITLRTTLITGHPGETEEDFRELKNFVRQFKFDRLGTFTYSDEEGTPAFTLENKVPAELAGQRQAESMELQRDISLEKNQALCDTEQLVLLDEFDISTNFYSGRTFRDAPEIDNEVLIPARPGTAYKPGDFAQVRIDEAAEYELYGHFTDASKEQIP